MTHKLRTLSWTAMALVVAVLTLAWAPPAFAHAEAVTVEPSQAEHGESVTVSGKGLAADRDLTIVLVGKQGTITVATVRTDASGDFSAQFVAPEEATPGDYQLEVRGGDDVEVVEFTLFEKGERPAAGAEVVFERSSSETIVIAIVALALVAAGTVLVMTGRRTPRA